MQIEHMALYVEDLEAARDLIEALRFLQMNRKPKKGRSQIK